MSSFESALSDHVASEAISSTVEEEAVVPSAVSSISKGIPRLSLSSKARCHGCSQQPSRHSRQNCPAYHVSCHNCGKTGHFSKICRQTRINAVETVDVSDRNNSLHISAVTMTPRIGQRHLAATINGKTVDMLIDSGSDLTIVSENTTKRLRLVFSPVARPVQNIVSANGTQVKMIDKITDACIETSQGYLIDTIWITDNLSSEAILGASSLSAFSALTIKYGGQLPALTVNNVTAASISTFTTHPPVKCFTHMDSSTPAIQAPSRRHSSEDKIFIHNEILKLLHSGKIRPSHSSWRSQAFVVWETG